MYKLVYQKSTCYPYCSAYWPQFLKNLNKECIQYLEIGSLHGGSLLMFHNMFGPNVQSTSIDPFMQCDHYTEYTNAHEENFEIYKMNTEQLGIKNKHIRKPSYEILPFLQNNFYDVIYVDGNHNLSSVLEDAVLCYRKLKPNGYLILDDINLFHSTEHIQTVNTFVNAYTKDKMEVVYETSDPIGGNQIILRKK